MGPLLLYASSRAISDRPKRVLHFVFRPPTLPDGATRVFTAGERLDGLKDHARRCRPYCQFAVAALETRELRRYSSQVTQWPKPRLPARKGPHQAWDNQEDRRPNPALVAGFAFTAVVWASDGQVPW
jgi:hypothetical protein